MDPYERTAWQEHCDHEFNAQYDSVSERYASELKDLATWEESESDYNYKCWREEVVKNPHLADELHRQVLADLRERIQLRKSSNDENCPF